MTRIIKIFFVVVIIYLFIISMYQCLFFSPKDNFNKIMSLILKKNEFEVVSFYFEGGFDSSYEAVIKFNNKVVLSDLLSEEYLFYQKKILCSNLEDLIQYDSFSSADKHSQKSYDCVQYIIDFDNLSNKNKLSSFPENYNEIWVMQYKNSPYIYVMAFEI